MCNLRFGRFFISTHHFSETHFRPITKIWRALHQNFWEKNWPGTLRIIKIESFRSFEPFRLSNLSFGRFFIPANHFSETHFFSITKMWRALHQNFGEKCLGTSWIIKSTFLGSLRGIFEPFWSISIDFSSLFSWKTHIFWKKAIFEIFGQPFWQFFWVKISFEAIILASLLNWNIKNL